MQIPSFSWLRGLWRIGDAKSTAQSAIGYL